MERTPNASTSTLTRAHACAFDPTPERANPPRSHMGGSRFADSTLLGLVRDDGDENRAKKDAGAAVSNDDCLSTSHFELPYLWAEKRDDAAPWWRENGAPTYNDAPSA